MSLLNSWSRAFSRLTIRNKLILSVALVHLVLMTVFVVDTVQRQRVDRKSVV